MRRVALAGVLAMRPELLVLDEATTGLDPRGCAQIHGLLKRLKSEGVAVLIVSNDMDEVASLVDSVTVLDRGRTVLQGPTREILAGEHRLEEHGLEYPSATRLVRELRGVGVQVSSDVLTAAEAEEAIWQALAR